MKMVLRISVLLSTLAVFIALALAQNNSTSQPGRPPGGGPPDGPGRPSFDGPPGPGGPGGGPGGRGGGPPPGGVQEDFKLLKQFDADGDKKLNLAERKLAREFLEKEKAEGRGPRRPGPPGGRRGGGGGPRPENQAPPEPGPKLSPAEVKNYSDAPLYDLVTLRTLFLEFDSPDWEKEMADFYRTDVEMPAKLTVDGKTYSDVGVHFRGASSFFTVGEGRKRSLNLSLDFIHDGQNLGGYRTLNLLNSHTDPTYLRSVLYYQVARDLMPAPKANYVRVVINGESWGPFVSAQQFNKDFIRDNYGTEKGARWKVPGSPRGNGGLTYLGPDPAPYQKIYEIKTKDDPKAWAALIQLCQALNETPPEKLEAALAPILDLDGVLKFLALENALINSDGYWIRASDYNLYLDPTGRFHIVPHDSNETFRTAEGPGAGGAGAAGVELDPLAGADDPAKPLLGKLLAVPSLKARYFGYQRLIAEKWLDWGRLEPLARQYQALIAADIQTDTRKLSSAEAFSNGVEKDTQEEGFRGPRQSISLKSFAEKRRAFLLNHPEIKSATIPKPSPAS